MSYTYTGSVSTDIEKIRLEIGDTSSADGMGVKPNGENFTDEELQSFLDAVDTWQQAAVKALRVLANMYASAARVEQVADVKLDLTRIASELREQANILEASLDADGSYAGHTVTTGTLDYSESYYSVSTTDCSVE